MGRFTLQTTSLSPKQSKLARKEFVIMVLFESGFVFPQFCDSSHTGSHLQEEIWLQAREESTKT
jgi:hypothetical protein